MRREKASTYQFHIFPELDGGLRTECSVQLVAEQGAPDLNFIFIGRGILLGEDLGGDYHEAFDVESL
jgi:hypothetical protein